MGKTLKIFGIVAVVLLVVGGLLFSYVLSNLRQPGQTGD